MCFAVRICQTGRTKKRKRKKKLRPVPLIHVETFFRAGNVLRLLMTPRTPETMFLYGFSRRVYKFSSIVLTPFFFSTPSPPFCFFSPLPSIYYSGYLPAPYRIIFDYTQGLKTFTFDILPL